MTTNQRLPLKVVKGNRRLFPVWTNISIRRKDGQVKPFWVEYWRTWWPWMRQHGGWQAVVYHLLNEVDLSGWDAGEAPPVTDYLREMMEFSEDPITTMIKDQKEQLEGLWAMPLMSSLDIHNAIRAGGETLLDIYGLKKVPGVRTISRVMGRDSIAPPIEGSVRNANDTTTSIKLWVFEEEKFYRDMSRRRLLEIYHGIKQEQLNKMLQQGIPREPFGPIMQNSS
jgi:hypothetical protein